MPRTPTFAGYVGGHPDSAEVLAALRRELDAIGPTEERVSRSQVAFRRSRTVALAWAPGQYLSGHGAPLVLTVVLPGPDPSPRWKEVVEAAPGRFTHHLELSRPDDIDDQVREWLRRAWQDAGERPGN